MSLAHDTQYYMFEQMTYGKEESQPWHIVYTRFGYYARTCLYDRPSSFAHEFSDVELNTVIFWRIVESATH